MKNYFSKSLMFALFMSATVACFAAARPICSERIYSGQEDRTTLYTNIMWETDEDGNVNVSVYLDNQTSWRGRGLADEVTTANGFTLLLNGTETADISTYFTKNYTTGSTVYQLKLNAGKTVPVGSVIKYAPTANICWKTAQDDNGWNKKNFEYIYGTKCDAEPVAAEGSTVCDSLFTSDTYQGDPNKGKDSKMLLSIQTYSDGSIHFDISSPTGDVETGFRRGEKSDALGGIGSFTYGDGQPLGEYFTLTGENHVTACVLTPIVGKTLPDKTEITYKGTVQWFTKEHPNCWASNKEFKFQYGTSCYEPTGIVNHNLNHNDNRNGKKIINGKLVIVTPTGTYSVLGKLQ